MNELQKFENKEVERLMAGKSIPDFFPGDTLRVSIKIKEGDKERIQAFEGVCLGRRNRGINSSFVVRKLSSGIGVERVFPLHSPKISKIEVVRNGSVRRAKLYYLRKLTGKAARIEERAYKPEAKAE